MSEKSLSYRGFTSLLTSLTAFYLCGGPQAAFAAQASRAKDEKRALALSALKIDAKMLDSPEAWQAQQAAAAKVRRAQAMERARAYAHADEQEAKTKAARDFATRLETAAEPQRVVRRAGLASAKGKSGTQLKNELLAEAPALRNAKPLTKVGPVLPSKERRQLKPVPPSPRLKGARGEMTRDIELLYASVAGQGAEVIDGDGELRAVEEVLYGYRAPKTKWMLASLASDTSFPLMGALPGPTADDLAETAETRRTPEILALVQRLGTRPLALYNHVHTTVVPQLYFGSKKGASATLRESAGNDFDTSSLLVALLRAANIPARYEHGVVRLSLAQAQALTGAKTAAQASFLLSSTGTPSSAEGDTVIVERVWVRAFVPYGDYKGTGAGGDSVWVRLDPGLKLATWKPAVSLRGLATFDSAAYLSAPNTKTPQEVFEAQLLAAAKAKNVCNNLADALTAPKLTEKPFELLPAEHPAQVLSSLLVFARVPSALQWTATVSLEGGSSRSFAVAELQYRKLALRYVGATAADDALIAAAGGLVNVAPFRVFVRGSLRLDGAEEVRFPETQPGQAQVLTVRVVGPNVAPAAMNHRIRAGSIYALSVTAGMVAPAYADELKAQVDTSSSDANIESAGHAANAVYASRQQVDAARAYQLQAHTPFQDVMESIAGREFSVTESFGLPLALSPGLYVLDVQRDALTPIPNDGNGSAVASLLELSGFHGSVLEQRAWESVFANRAIAAVPVIQEANAQGIGVLTFTGGAATGLTGYSQGALEDVGQALAAGWRVSIPQRPVTVPGYVGVEAYVLFNPVSGDGAYIIGHANGGGTNGPGNNPGPPNCPTCSNNNQPLNSVVNLANGRFMESFTDLALPAIGLPVVFSRHYASDFQALTSLGVGWLHSYAVFLRTEPNGDVTFFTEDTTAVRFVRSGATFTAPVGWYLTLTSIAGGFRVRAKDGFVWEFDASGRLTRMADTSNNATTMQYTGALLTAVLDSSGAAALTLSYAGNKLTGVTDRAGRSISFGYTGDDLVSATDVLGVAELYSYDARHLLASRTDRRGKVWRTVFDAFRRWAATIDADGKSAHATYDILHLTTVYFDKTGAAWRSVHNAAGNLIEHTDPLGEVKKYEWTSQERTRAVDGRGFATVMTYDARGNMLTQLHADGRIDTMTYEATFSRQLTHSSTGLPNVTNTYDTAGRLKTRNAGLGVTTFNYDARGQLANTVEPGAATTTFGHDGNGNVTSITDATSRVSSMGYDAAGHLTSTTDGNGKTRTMEVDAAGRVRATIDALSQRSEFTYDGDGRRLTSKDAANAVTRFDYDDFGRLVAVTDAAGQVSRTEYDAEGRVVATVDARGNRSLRRYDAAGRMFEATDATGAVTSSVYCADIGSACADVDALGNLHTREFDEVGRVTREVDALGRETVMAYDTAGRVSSEVGPGRPPTTYGYSVATGLMNVTTTPSMSVQYQYDNRGNRTQVQVGSQITRYTFDLANRLLTETNPLNKVTTFTYDAAGNRRTKLDANGHTTTYGYDDNRRLSRVDFDDGTAYEYAFDSRGNRTLEKGPSHERRLRFDALNRLDIVDDVTFGKQLVYGYDAVGNRTSLSEGGVTQSWEYDARDMLAAARVGAGPRTLFGYDADGRRSFVARPNGVRTTYAFDEASQLLSMVHAKAGNVLLGFSYAYDGKGNRVSKAREDGTAELYGYDSSMRLTQVDYGTSKTVEYTLDNLGNRSLEVQTVRPAVGTPVVTNFNGGFNAFNQQLTRTRSGGGLPSLNTTFAYDDIGNTISESTISPATTTTYSWDRDNRLRAVTPPAPAVPTQYAYDANGLRIERVDATGTTRYLLDGVNVLGELGGSNALTIRYMNNPTAIDEVIGFERNGSFYFLLTDALGSVYAYCDARGEVTRRLEFDVLGVLTDLGGTTDPVDVGFTGRWHDLNGLIEHRNRQRDPKTGGWLSSDPLGHIAGANAFAYADGLPTMATDPHGLYALPCTDTVSCTAVNNYPLFILLMIGEGLRIEEQVEWAKQEELRVALECTDEEDPQFPLIYRGLSGTDVAELRGVGFGGPGLGVVTSNYMRAGNPLAFVEFAIRDPNAIAAHIANSSVPPSPFVSGTYLRSKADFFATSGANPGGYVLTFQTSRTPQVPGFRLKLFQYAFGSLADQELLFPGQIGRPHELPIRIERARK